ncbi:ATP-binding protein [Nucisporomicrobium flavum]|uniref:ATP-binding protein n=1 Tax=Nucisporomicrobium flavum TaxID=2785915 RepID=UPI003C2C3145
MFGEVLKRFRVREMLTQEELAASCGVSVRQIRELEAGRIRTPRAATVRALEGALGLSPTDVAELRQATTGAKPSPGPAAPPPAQLPGAIEAFTGRSAELADLDEATAGTVLIHGTAGVGKTALAVHWAHRHAARYDAGQLYADLRGFDPSGEALDPGEALRGFLGALGVAPHSIPAGTDAQAALYRSHTAGRRLLVILDNARDAGQVRPLLPGGPDARTVVTSRRRLTALVAGAGAATVDLDVPPAADAARLLTRRLGPGGTHAGAVDEVVRACGRLPLALALVGARARLTGFPLAVLAAQLRGRSGRLDALEADDRGARAVFSWSYRALSRPAATMFRLLGLTVGPDIATAAAAALAGSSSAAARKVLTELADAALVVEHVPGRYTMHDLLRAYAGELSRAEDSGEARRAALTGLLDHYTLSAYHADLILNPVRAPIPLALPDGRTDAKPPAGPEEALAWLDTEREVLLTALRQAADEGRHTHAWQLSWALDTFLHERGRWHDEGAAWAVALRAATAMADQPAAAHAHRFLGAVNGRLARFDEADRHLRRAVAVSRSAGDRQGEAEGHFVLSYVRWLRGDPAGALRHAERSLSSFAELDEPLWEGKAALAVGWYRDQLGDFPDALHFYERALAAQERSGNRANEAVTHDGIGLVHQHLGDHESAQHHFLRGLDLAVATGHPILQAQLCTHLGDAGEAIGDRETATARWAQAYRILHPLRHPQAADLRRKLRFAGAPAEENPRAAGR